MRYKTRERRLIFFLMQRVSELHLRAKVGALNPKFDAGGTLELGFAVAAFRFALPCLHRRHASAAVGQRERAAAVCCCSHLRSEGGTPTPTLRINAKWRLYLPLCYVFSFPYWSYIYLPDKVSSYIFPSSKENSSKTSQGIKKSPGNADQKLDWSSVNEWNDFSWSAHRPSTPSITISRTFLHFWRNPEKLFKNTNM